MKLVYPDFYNAFHCIAGGCRHSCCVGWEIDIDEDSMRRYGGLKGAIGQELRDNIDILPAPHFRLSSGERCPFLRSDGLCRMILELGEDCLCDICREHPRFRNYFTDRTELGLGLCCEEAARLLLRDTAPLGFVCEDDGGDEQLTDWEKELLERRGEAIKLLQNRRLSLSERLRRLMEGCPLPGGSFCTAKWAKELLSLERMDEAWTGMLKRLEENGEKASGRELLAFMELRPEIYERLLCYFIFRHFTGEDFETDAQALSFCTLSVFIIAALDMLDGEERRIEHVRLYSSEIEYSDENIPKLTEHL